MFPNELTPVSRFGQGYPPLPCFCHKARFFKFLDPPPLQSLDSPCRIVARIPSPRVLSSPPHGRPGIFSLSFPRYPTFALPGLPPFARAGSIGATIPFYSFTVQLLPLLYRISAPSFMSPVPPGFVSPRITVSPPLFSFAEGRFSFYRASPSWRCVSLR